MAERLTAGIFDVGGVLVHFDPKDFHRGMTEGASLETDLDIAKYQELWREVSDPLHTGQKPPAEISEQFKKLTGVDLQLDEQPPDSLLTTVLAKLARPNKETLDIVYELQEKGLQTAIVSDSTQPHASVVEATRVYEPFPSDLRVLSHVEGVRKPYPEIYNLALSRLDVAPQNAFFVDDKQRNVDGANALGIHGLIFTSAKKLRSDLRELGVPLRKRA